VLCSNFILQICTHSDFELIVLLMIFGNCISLAAYDPIHHDGPRNQMLEKIGVPISAPHVCCLFENICAYVASAVHSCAI
jgi:hypothetical protein